MRAHSLDGHGKIHSGKNPTKVALDALHEMLHEKYSGSGPDQPLMSLLSYKMKES